MKSSILTRKDKVGILHFDSIQWAFEVHLKEFDKQEYNTAVLWGNEDAPEKIEFFKSKSPHWKQEPDFIWKAEKEVECSVN